MMKLALIILSVHFSIACIAQMDIQKISRLLGRKQDDKTGRLKTKRFCEVRKELFKTNPHLFTITPDTIYFVEKYDQEGSTYYGTIWTKKDTVHYSYFANKITIESKSFFTNQTIRLISSWDLSSIKKEETKYPNAPYNVYAARCAVVDNKCIINVLKVRYFVFDQSN